ncbi:hypothetical protein HY490_01360 [Candidatus Woesearchaeota archaeon]|nr:hypothetical protein [Candidatus Woesearchaeota archaeon]
MNVSRYELERLLRLRQAHDSCQRTEPVLKVTTEPLRSKDGVDSVCVAFGSFDPPTMAHVAIMQRAREALHTEEILAIESTRHVDKKVDVRQHSTLYDRAYMMEACAETVTNLAVAMTNVGLFVDLLPQVNAVYKHADVSFVMGVDVLEKLADTKYYTSADERDSALKLLCTHRIAVSDRDVGTVETVNDVVARVPALQPHADSFVRVEQPRSLLGLSATTVRSNRRQGLSIADMVPPAVADIVQRWALYEDNDRYARFVAVREEYATSKNVHDLAAQIQAI